MTSRFAHLEVEVAETVVEPAPSTDYFLGDALRRSIGGRRSAAPGRARSAGALRPTGTGRKDWPP